MCDSKLKQWIEIALQKEELIDYSFTIQGKTNKDSGYLGNITFVLVNGKTKTGASKTLNLVIKSSKESTILRNQVPVKEAFEKEIYIYDRIIPAFENFQKEKGIEKLIKITPYCYATQKTGDNELLILENLKPSGYSLWDRKVPMTSEHLKIILEALAKWHGLSFALKNEKPETFQMLTQNTSNMFSEWFAKIDLFDHMWKTFNNAKKNLISNNEIEALKKVDFSRDDIKYILVDLFFEEPEYHVILHGDCWTNNFLFKYEKNSAEPSDIRLLDFQCSGVGSPVIDLSFLFYSCGSQEVFNNFGTFLKIYHNSLSTQLKKLGVDAEEVYSYDTLLRQWKRFSRYGVVITAFILRFSLCEADDAPDFAELAEKGYTFIEGITFSLKNEEQYLERVTNNLHHYVKYP